MLLHCSSTVSVLVNYICAYHDVDMSSNLLSQEKIWSNPEIFYAEGTVLTSHMKFLTLRVESIN